MAVTQLADGRWVCYYRVPNPDGRSRIKKQYFGRGLDAESAAYRRNDELALKKRRPVRTKTAPKFYELAKLYTVSRNFNQNSKKHLQIRLTATILPLLGNKTATNISDTEWKGALKRAGIIRRLRPYDLRHFFITHALENGADIKALSEIVGSRPETLMRHYQHVTTELRRKTIAKIPNLGSLRSFVPKRK